MVTLKMKIIFRTYDISESGSVMLSNLRFWGSYA